MISLRSGWVTHPWRALALAWALILLSAACGLYAVFGVLLRPAPGPPVEPSHMDVAPLTEHLALIVVDGLRYDIGTDPKRMPHFASAMKRHASGEMWAGQVTMSSSAVLAWGTGQWGQMEQLVLNMFSGPPEVDAWPKSAKAKGLRLLAAGDFQWKNMYGEHFERTLVDPDGVALDFDFNAQTFADARELRATNPNFLVAHFTTPDHQGHVYGVLAPEYNAHMLGYDADLHAFLSELDDSWTVIATSDHGASDGGSHGIGVPIQQRTPIFAYGPGIAKGARIERMGQVDLANTMAVLLGVSPPAHSRGHVTVELLDLDATTRQSIACGEANRAVRHAEARLESKAPDLLAQAQATCSAASAEDAVAKSRALVRGVDERVASKFGLAAPVLWWFLAGAALLALLAALGLLGLQVAPAIPGALAIVLATTALVYQVERFAEPAPNVIRVILFTIFNLIAVAVILIPGRTARWLDDHPRLAGAVVPGLLVACYPANAQPEALVAIFVCAVFFLLSGDLAKVAHHVFASGVLRISRRRFVAVLLLVVVLVPAGVKQQDVHLPWLFGHKTAVLVAALAAVALWAVLRTRRLGNTSAERYALAVGLPIALGALVYGRYATPLLGRAVVVLLVLGAVSAALTHRRSLAMYVGFAGYAMLARDAEVFPVLASIALAETLGEAVAQSSAREGKRRLSTVLLVVAFAFGLLYVQRVAIQGGLDIGSLQPAAGFGDPAPPWWVVGVAMTLKWEIPALMALGGMLAYWPAALGSLTLRALIVVYLARIATMLLMLGVAGGSFSTAMRCLGDLPFTLVGAVACGLAWLGMNASRAQTSGEPSLAEARA